MDHRLQLEKIWYLNTISSLTYETNSESGFTPTLLDAPHLQTKHLIEVTSPHLLTHKLCLPFPTGIPSECVPIYSTTCFMFLKWHIIIASSNLLTGNIHNLKEVAGADHISNGSTETKEDSPSHIPLSQTRIFFPHSSIVW